MAEDINKPEKQQGKSKSETKSKSLADESYQKSQGKAYNQSVYAHVSQIFTHKHRDCPQNTAKVFTFRSFQAKSSTLVHF